MYHAILGAIASALLYSFICLVQYLRNRESSGQKKSLALKGFFVPKLSAKNILITFGSIIVLIFAYLLLLNGRYEVIDKHTVFDKWEKVTFRPDYKKSTD
ncbi:MAG: hypothetical protein KBT20_08835 [Bacteroidales bacterium]|nr:hypothetical protein [Candidatus Liminaster caballi]